MRPSQIYKSYKQGSTPDSSVKLDDDGMVDRIVSTSQRGDTVLVQHSDEYLYKSIRIVPEYQSNHSAMMDDIRNPSSGFSKDFKHCSYQLLEFSAPEFRQESANIRPRDVHRKCHWNSTNATRKRTATSENRIQDAWEKFL